MVALLSSALALLIGLLMTRVFKLLKLQLPDVTAFLIAGVIIGPYCLGRLGIPGVGFSTTEEVEGLSVISNTALGFIAFSIGNEFLFSQLKSIGKQAVIVGVFQALAATLLVDLALFGLHLLMPNVLSVEATIVLGAIATATAPAATLMVVRQYKAKGKLTDILLPVVALDDAVGLAVFAVSFGVATSIVTGKTDLTGILIEPLIEIAASLALGSLLGWILTLLERTFFSNSNRLSLTIAFVVLTVALSMLSFEIGGVKISFSTLLVCMMLGTVFCNICPLSHDLMERADKWTAPLFALFFVLSGAELELSVLLNAAVLIVGVTYIIARSAGKYIGSYLSCAATKCDPVVRKYLGITLLPQAGVALGMCVTAAKLGTSDGVLIKNIILFSVLVYELVGPLLTKWALTKSGDISPSAVDVQGRRAKKFQEAVDKKTVSPASFRRANRVMERRRQKAEKQAAAGKKK
ncbi:MAG: cation:proton antiporter [Clostridia bacterium]|nr:cation:proton antiporter [Clostridia bacterium]